MQYPELEELMRSWNKPMTALAENLLQKAEHDLLIYLLSLGLTRFRSDYEKGDRKEAKALELKAHHSDYKPPPIKLTKLSKGIERMAKDYLLLAWGGQKMLDHTKESLIEFGNKEVRAGKGHLENALISFTLAKPMKAGQTVADHYKNSGKVKDVFERVNTLPNPSQALRDLLTPQAEGKSKGKGDNSHSTA